MIILLIIIVIILFLYFRFKFPKEVNILITKLKRIIFGKKKRKRKNKNITNTCNISNNEQSHNDKLNCDKSNCDKSNCEKKLNIEKARSEIRKLINKNEENQEQNELYDENLRPPSPTVTEIFRLDSNDLLNHAMSLE